MNVAVDIDPPCINHPETPTGVKCSRCLSPICVKCAVRTDVGMRCPDCAGVKLGRGGTYYVPSVLTEVTRPQLLRALGAGLAVAIVGGLAWGQFRTAGDLGDWSFWLVLAISIAAGEGVARAANERRGARLQAIAAGSVALAALVALGWQAYSVFSITTLGELRILLFDGFGPRIIGATLPNGLFTLGGMIFAALRLKL